MKHRARAMILAGGAVWAAGLAPFAQAADIAVLIDNSGGGAGLLADVLNARGYEVYDRQDASRADIAEVLSQVAARLDETDRLILGFFGATVQGGGRTWLAPDGFDGGTIVDAAFGAVDLRLLADLAASRAGRSAVLLGTVDAGPEPGGDGPLDLRPGIAGVDLPQGILLLSGPVDAVTATVQDDLLAEDRTVAEALGDLAEGIEVGGFVSPDAAFADAGAQPTVAAPAPPPAPAPAAAPPQVDPAAAAEAAETALALDQAARRRIQEQLTVIGFGTRGIDGLFGPGTRSAIGQWQEGQDLAATGYLNPEQLRLLTAEADARSAELAAAAESARQEEEAADAAFWRTTGSGGSAADLRAYLARYPDGIYAAEARTALERLEADARADAEAGDRAAWDAAVAGDTTAAYQDYLEAFPNGAFADQSRARIAALDASSERADADQAAAAAEDGLGLNQGSRVLIEGQLSALGFDVGAADGVFDADTRRALREFQTRQGLEVTGYVDQQSVRALIVASLGLR